MRKIVYVLYLILSACSGSEKKVADIPVIDLDAADTRDVNLSALIESARIIPLETNQEVLIDGSSIWVADDFILIGSGVALFRFDLNGKFIDKIGGYGRGPGEHLGWARNIRYYKDTQQIQVNWGGGQGFDPQLFTNDGKFIREITLEAKNDFNTIIFCERLNDSTWFGSSQFTTGSINLSVTDSTLIHFFSNDGREVGSIRRTIFPTHTNPAGIMPAVPPLATHYKKDNTWKFFLTSLDTLFRIEGMHLVPEVIFKGENLVDYNAADLVTEVEGKTQILSIEEGDNYWLLNSTRLPIKSDFEIPLIFVDKHTLQATSVRLVDDVFGLFPGTFFGENWLNPDGRKPFQDQLMYLVVDAVELLPLLQNKSGTVTPQMQAELDKLHTLKEDDNPVIFLFTLKELPLMD